MFQLVDLALSIKKTGKNIVYLYLFQVEVKQLYFFTLSLSNCVFFMA